MRWFTRDFRRQFTEWPHVIAHVDASPMRRDYQIESARMNLQGVHPHRRQITNPDPEHPLVERGERAEMRARIKQFRIYRIFADYFHRVVRRSEERRVGKECRSRWAALRYRENEKTAA